MKMSSDTIGIRNRHLQFCSAVSEPSASLSALKYSRGNNNLICSTLIQISHTIFCEVLGWSRLRSGSACYHSVRNLLSLRLLSKNFKIKIYRTIILPVVL